MSIVMLPNFIGLCFTCESWDTKLVKRVESLPCEGKSWSYYCWFLVGDTFADHGAKGEEDQP
jgi:hypothetical protein